MAGDLTISTINGQAIGVKNAVINGNFNVNQRGVSGTVTLAAGAYGHDRFKAGASGCTYTFATAANITTLTISAGSLIQVVEGLNLQTDTYTLSWVGTAHGKIGAGSFAGSGVTGAVTGGTNLNLEFNTGTLSRVQLEKGSTATSFDYRPYGTELGLCQRYYFKILPASGNQAFGVGFNDSTTAARAVAQFPVVMRTSPTALEQTGTAADYQIRFTGGAATTCSSVPSFSDSNPYRATFIFTVASGLTGGQASLSRAVNSTAFLAWSAEL